MLHLISMVYLYLKQNYIRNFEIKMQVPLFVQHDYTLTYEMAPVMNCFRVHYWFILQSNTSINDTSLFF